MYSVIGWSRSAARTRSLRQVSGETLARITRVTGSWPSLLG
jgi:hypothetical protein